MTDTNTWLRAALAAGPVEARDLRQQADAAGIHWRSVQRAGQRIGATIKRHGSGAAHSATWALATHPPADAPGLARQSTERNPMTDSTRDTLGQSIADLLDEAEFTPLPAAAALLARLRAAGLHVEPTPEGIRIRPQRLLSAEDRSAIAARMDELAALVRAQQPALRPPTPQERARAAELFEHARPILGDHAIELALGRFSTEPARVIAEVENAVAERKAQAVIEGDSQRAYAWLLRQPGRCTGIEAARRGISTDPWAVDEPYGRSRDAEVARCDAVWSTLMDAGLVERRGDVLVATA